MMVVAVCYGFLVYEYRIRTIRVSSIGAIRRFRVIQVSLVVAARGAHGLPKNRPLVPQLMQELSAHYFRSEHAYHTQNEHAVELQILVDKNAFELFGLDGHGLAFAEYSFGLQHNRRALIKLLEVFQHVQALVNVAFSRSRHHSVYPLTQRPEIGKEQNQKPKPEKREYLLVVQVDGQHALYGISMAEIRMSELSDAKVTHDHLGKIDRFHLSLYIVSVRQISKDVDAEFVELLAQELVHDEKLHDRVEQVDKFDEEIRGHQVIAQVNARSAKQRFAKVFYSLKERVVSATTSRIACVLVYVLHHVFHDFGFACELLHGFVRMSRFDQVTHVQAGSTRQQAPHDSRNVQKQRLNQENEWDPLVVLDLGALSRLVRIGHQLALIHIVSVRNPAHLKRM